MKIIIILLDGVGDRSFKALEHRTPLQAAATPNMDRLASLGSNGLFHAASPGQCLPSELAHYLMFGYDPEDFPGRGLLEAVGHGVPFDDQDVLCLAHLSGVTLQGGVPILTHGRNNIKGDAREIQELFASISTYETSGVRFQLSQTGPNDAILIIKGLVSPDISDSDPMIVGRAMARVCTQGGRETEIANLTAQAMNDYLSYCYRVLSSHPVNRLRGDRDLPLANFLATQRSGRRTVQEPFSRRWGMNGLLIASGSVYMGLAHELGLDSLRVKDTDSPGKDLEERIRSALTDPYHDFIHVHTKAPDEAAHGGDPREKKSVISSLDTGLAELAGAVETRENLLVAICADHSTPSMSQLIHSGEPVPVTLAGPSVRRDEVKAFDEISAAAGCLGLLRGQELMLMLLNYADRSTLLGHRLGKNERPYVPDNYDPLKLKDVGIKGSRAPGFE